MPKRPAPDFTKLRSRLRSDHQEAHAAFYRAETFTGPSLHFHRAALASASAGDISAFASNTYAVLTAWGMHRMGRGGSKMCDYEPFRASLELLWPRISMLRQASGPGELDGKAWADLRDIFMGIRCMQTRTLLVGNSKVMAHALPLLIPPVDREYTLRYAFGTTSITNDPTREWETLSTLLREFFHPLVDDQTLRPSIGGWLARGSEFPWDTSAMKVLDNLVIGAVKLAAWSAHPEPLGVGGSS